MSVLSVNSSASHTFSKPSVPSITLVPNLGVQGDAHAGATVKHRSRLHINPPPPNLRQVHLIHSEILSSASNSSGDDDDDDDDDQLLLRPGELGENITTAGIDLLVLGKGTKLRFVSSTTATTDGSNEADDDQVAVVEVTGLRNPCPQIDRFRKGLKEKFVVRDQNREIVSRRAGIMGIVESGGEVRPGMTIVIEKPTVHEPLECV